MVTRMMIYRRGRERDAPNACDSHWCAYWASVALELRRSLDGIGGGAVEAAGALAVGASGLRVAVILPYSPWTARPRGPWGSPRTKPI